MIGMKMTKLSDVLLNKHYAHHKDKSFFTSLKRYMKTAPVLLVALEGLEAVNVTRLIVGPTSGRAADAGSIRGDLSMSVQANIVHASDSVASSRAEIKRFFKSEGLFNYRRNDFNFIYSEEEMKK